MAFSQTRVLVIEEHFEAERIILILPESEPIIRQQESIITRSVAVQQLIAFPVA